MPYDSAKTRQMLTIVGAFANLPGGEYIADLAKQLTEAEAEITAAVNGRLKAEGDANRYASELATMQSTMRQMREENEGLKAALPAPKKQRATPANLIALPSQKTPAGSAPAPELAATGTTPSAPKRARKVKSATPQA